MSFIKKLSIAARFRSRNTLTTLKETFLKGTEFIFPETDPIIKDAIKHLRSRIHSLPPLPMNGVSAADGKWLKFRRLIRSYMLTRNPNKFLRWEPLRSTMSIAELDERELVYLKSSPDWEFWSNALNESKIGCPIRYAPLPQSSANLVHHAYSLSKFSNLLHVDVPSLNSVLEIGGGYGSMCRLFFQKGFTGSYMIFDLPEFSILQEFFLSLTLGEQRLKNIQLTSELSDLKVSPRPDLILATWSISEMSVRTRENILNAAGKPKYFLFAYQKKFGEVDNTKYFREFQESHPEYEWFTETLPHLSGDGNCHLFGKLK